MFYWIYKEELFDVVDLQHVVEWRELLLFSYLTTMIWENPNNYFYIFSFSNWKFHFQTLWVNFYH